MELTFQVKNQRLYLTTVNKVVADSKNYLIAAFSFTEDWNGTVKVAQFTRGTTTTNVGIDASTGKCTIPQSVLSGEGEFFVSVYGTKENGSVIITVNAIKITVLPSGFIANAGTISSADAAALAAHADAVEAIADNADESVGGYVHTILFTIRNQSMYLTTRGRVVADSQGYLGAKFLFSEDWDNVIKIAQFKRGNLFYNIMLDENDECTVPWEVLVDEGVFIANVFGNNLPNAENRIITVNPVEVHVEKSGLTDGELPHNPTTGVDGQVLYEITQYTTRAEAAAETATTAAANALGYAQSISDSVSTASGYATDAESYAGAAAQSASDAHDDALALSNAVSTVQDLVYGLAPLESPAFTGIPTAPTATAGTNSTQIATTAYADTAAANAAASLVNSAPSALDTLAELSAALGDDPNFATTVATDIGKKVDKTSADYIKSASVSGKTLTLTKGDNTTVTFTEVDTQYTASNGITLTGTNFTNSGVRSVATGATNGTISVNTNGTAAEVSVYGLKSAAYTESSAYAGASHTHDGTEVSLTGYSKPSSASALAATDTVNEALGKLEKLLDNYLPLAGGTLTGNVNGITQSAGDNSTKLATTAYADTAASNAVNANPHYEYDSDGYLYVVY